MQEFSIPEIVFEFFRLLKMQPIEIRKGVWQVHVDDALAKELDGWRAKGGLFQFTFEKKLADNYGAELISPGSYRLDTIIQVIRKQALLSQAHLSHHVFHEPNIRKKVLQKLSNVSSPARFYVLNHSLEYGMYLWIMMRISFITHEMKEQIQKPLVDLTTGRVLSLAIPTHLFSGGMPESGIIKKRRVSYKQAYSNAGNYIIDELALMDDSWAVDSWERIHEEQTKLDTFFEGQSDSEQRIAKMHELLERAAPRVQLRPLRTSVLYLPRYHYRIMEAGLTEQIHETSFDPVSNELEILS